MSRKQPKSLSPPYTFAANSLSHFVVVSSSQSHSHNISLIFPVLALDIDAVVVCTLFEIPLAPDPYELLYAIAQLGEKFIFVRL